MEHKLKELSDKDLKEVAIKIIARAWTIVDNIDNNITASLFISKNEIKGKCLIVSTGGITSPIKVIPESQARKLQDCMYKIEKM